LSSNITDFRDRRRGTCSYFGMGVSASDLKAAITAASVAREHGGLGAPVSMSRLTVSRMSLRAMTDSLQQDLRWPGEQTPNRSGLHPAALRHLEAIIDRHERCRRPKRAHGPNRDATGMQFAQEICMKLFNGCVGMAESRSVVSRHDPSG